MQMVSSNCPACGGIYTGKITNRFVTCDYCGSRFALSEDELRAFGFTDADGDGYDDNDDFSDDDDRDYDSSQPMYAFAEDACREFLDNTSHASSFEDTRKIRNGLGIESGNDVYLIHDDTLFKSGKNGFAITYGGFYCREFGEGSAKFTSWDDFGRGKKPALEDSYIRQGAKAIAYFTDSESGRNELMDLVQRLYRHAR